VAKGRRDTTVIEGTKMAMTKAEKTIRKISL
jgi:hypothetical protein